MTQEQVSDNDHIVKSFDEELDQMKSDILRMGGLVEAHIASAMEALAKRDPELAQRTIDADEAIDKMRANDPDGFSEDTSVEVLSSFPFDFAGQIDAVETALAARR